MRAEGKTRQAEREPQKSNAIRHARSAAATAVLYLSSSLIPHPSSLAWAAHPFITDDTGTQGKGNWQLELQGDFVRGERTSNTGAVQQSSKVDAFTSVLSFGILENLDIQAGLTLQRQRTTENGAVTAESSGLADSAIELKWRFYDADNFSLALKPGVALPTGDEDEGLGTGRASWGVTLIGTYEAEPWTLLANVAYTRARYKLPQDAADNRSNIWRVSGGVAYSVSGAMRLVGELGVRTNGSRDDTFPLDRTSQFAMLGVIYSPSKSIDLDTGYRKSLNDAEFDKAFLVGATFRW
jgi:hypothetical protein